jgi:hypothetical protein
VCLIVRTILSMFHQISLNTDNRWFSWLAEPCPRNFVGWTQYERTSPCRKVGFANASIFKYSLSGWESKHSTG